ncbi:hypothetical protein pdul_cds_307 [Pandoravirus dulcis]|uniref:DUF5860 domain-containing protein n=1 Tax=Pandoravirus dulcis TaxID=1349409 RepID=S4VPU8_9VIRU|nr:hypothetical protein pdul_cds_307 [Pandoravirus dulcis]AGO82297.1 hypothetical protein pdul_cds_307 [Pandoravirus dulcis]
MDTHVANKTEIATAAAVHPPVPDLWNMYPAVDRDDILKAIWIDGALKDVAHDWMPAGWPGVGPLAYSLTDDDESVATFVSRLLRFHEIHVNLTGDLHRIVLCVRRGPYRAELFYRVVNEIKSARCSGADGAADAAPTESAPCANSLDSKAHIDDDGTAATTKSVRSADTAEVAAALDRLLATVPHDWVSDRLRVDTDAGHLIRAPAGPGGAAVRRATAEAISNHAYAVIGASGGRPHRLVIHGAASADGKQIELFYQILPTAASPIDHQALTATPAKDGVPAGDCPASPDVATTTTPEGTIESQTAVEILALYPKLSVAQATCVLLAETALDGVPHQWIKDDANVDARYLCSHDLSVGTDCLPRKVQACLDKGWQRVVLSIRQTESDRTIATISALRPPSSPKSQTIDDLLDLYPTLSAREAVCLTKVIEGLAGVPVEWVHQDSGHAYDDDGIFGDASKVVAHVREAFAQPAGDTGPRHVVLTLHRKAAAASGPHFYHFIILPSV